MTAELFKKTEETAIINGIEVKKTVGMEVVLMENEEQAGMIIVNRHGGNFHLNKPFDDVEGVINTIIELLIAESEV